MLFPSGGGYTVEFPIVEGAAYWMEFSERGIGTFKDALEVSDFPKERFFDVGDAVLHAGARFLADVTNPGDGNAAFGTDDGNRRVLITDDEVRIENGDNTALYVTGTQVRLRQGGTNYRFNPLNGQFIPV